MKHSKTTVLLFILVCLSLGFYACQKEDPGSFSNATPEPSASYHFYHQSETEGMVQRIEVRMGPSGTATVSSTSVAFQKGMVMTSFAALGVEGKANTAPEEIQYSDMQRLWFVPFDGGIPELFGPGLAGVEVDCSCSAGEGCRLDANFTSSGVDFQCSNESCGANCSVTVTFGRHGKRPAGILVPAEKMFFRCHSDASPIEILNTETLYSASPNRPDEMFAITLAEFANGSFSLKRRIVESRPEAELIVGLVLVGDIDHDSNTGHLTNLGAKTRYIPFDPGKPMQQFPSLAGVTVDCNCMATGSCDLAGSSRPGGGFNYTCQSRNCSGDCSMHVTFNRVSSEPIDISGPGLLLPDRAFQP